MDCVDCGKHTYTTYGKYGYIALCDDCFDKRLHAELDEKSHSDNQGLANSFRNALKWAKIDLYAEQEKWAEKRRGNEQ